MAAIGFDASKNALVRDCRSDLVLRLAPNEFDLTFSCFTQSSESIYNKLETYDGWVYDVKVYEYRGYKLKVYRRMGMKDVFVVHGDGSKIMVVRE